MHKHMFIDMNSGGSIVAGVGKLGQEIGSAFSLFSTMLTLIVLFKLIDFLASFFKKKNNNDSAEQQQTQAQSQSQTQSQTPAVAKTDFKVEDDESPVTDRMLKSAPIEAMRKDLEFNTFKLTTLEAINYIGETLTHIPNFSDYFVKARLAMNADSFKEMTEPFSYFVSRLKTLQDDQMKSWLVDDALVAHRAENETKVESRDRLLDNYQMIDHSMLINQDKTADRIQFSNIRDYIAVDGDEKASQDYLRDDKKCTVSWDPNDAGITITIKGGQYRKLGEARRRELFFDRGPTTKALGFSDNLARGELKLKTMLSNFPGLILILFSSVSPPTMSFENPSPVRLRRVLI